MSLNHGQTVLFVLGICLGLSVMGSDAFAVQTQQVNQQLVQAVTGVENFLMGPISKLVIYSVFTLSFLAALVKQSVPGAIFAVGGALAYHQVTGWVNQTFTLLI